MEGEEQAIGSSGSAPFRCEEFKADFHKEDILNIMRKVLPNDAIVSEQAVNTIRAFAQEFAEQHVLDETYYQVHEERQIETVSAEAMQLKHFSHEEHPLILNELQTGRRECYACQKQITQEAAYSCSACDIFLHRICAESPQKISHPLHSQHPLELFAKPPSDDTDCTCNLCRRSWNGFTYHCSSCNFNVDISCALEKQKLQHGSHEHQLILQHRPAKFHCDACNLTLEEDSSYICTTCPFWIHKNCALLPRTFKRGDHDHDLSLAYSLPSEYRNFKLNCDVCNYGLNPDYWIYYCAPCRYFVHVRCMRVNTGPGSSSGSFLGFVGDFFGFGGAKDESKSEEELNQNLVHFPVSDVALETIRFFIEKKGLREDPLLQEINHFSHEEHPLILSNRQLERVTQNDEMICDGCVEPISDVYYGCVQCKYFLHLPCAQLPKELQHPSHPDGQLSLSKTKDFFVLFDCALCKRPSNGFFYKCASCNFTLDIKCPTLPTTFAHEAHKHVAGRKHFIAQSEGSEVYCRGCGATIERSSPLFRWPWGSGCNTVHPRFSCEPCSFHMDYNCALLPRTVNHRWDRHPLALIFPPYSNHPDEFYCEICEEEIHPKYWLYHCWECDQSFHSACIPRLGSTRNIKFGGKLSIDKHSHPLNFVREGKFRSSCEICIKSLYGEMAFQCEPCKFYMCHECLLKLYKS